MPRGQPRRMTAFYMHPQLADRLKDQAAIEQRSQGSIVEQALAEYLNVAPARYGIPQAILELCPRCMRGVLIGRHGQCSMCRWDRRQLSKTTRK